MRPRLLAPLLALALAATACGTTSNATDDGGSTAEGQAVATADPTADTASAEAVVLFEDTEPVDGRATVRQHADGSRTVETAWGAVTVPATPKRVVSVIGDIEPVEKIVTLTPDLIFTHDQESAELLGEVAPAVPRGAWRGDWKQDLRYIGAVLGRSAEVDLSLERLPDIDADQVFWQVRQDENGEPDTTGVDVARDTPLWDRMPAAAADQVHFVDDRPWYFPAILGAHVVLDDVEAALDADAA